MKKWKILNQSRIKDIKKVLLENRQIKTKEEIEEFLDPKLNKVTAESVGIDKRELVKAINRIKTAIKNKERIVVFGDYDVDGICGTAILWETLNSLGAEVMPYIPHRVDEGYGLSIRGIENIKNQKSNLKNVELIITVDNGIVANEAVKFANEQSIDVIVTDHHVPSKVLPKALAIVHTTKLCGTGVAYMLAQELKMENFEHLELVALATVADLVPLVGANRTLLKFGLEKLKQTKRIGLLELFKEAVLDPLKIDVYAIGHIIAPRINAMGRLEYAMDSLRLICTKNKDKAKVLALKLGSTNKERQQVTIEASEHAILNVRKGGKGKLLFVANEEYQQGVIGLVAGKLVEEFYKPAIVISKGEKFSKASARSISGFNIIEFIRKSSDLLVDAGGHPMAAGFTVETSKLIVLEKRLRELGEKDIDINSLIRTLKIDCELPLSSVTGDLYDSIQKLSPFGMGNPEPTFMSKNVIIEDIRLVGMDGKHIKLKIKDQKSNIALDGIGFGMGESSKLHIGDKVDIAYTIDENEWLGSKRLQLKIKDLK
ncbi:MAG: single-stranded-DNA-specific exonuclease RecJ [Candidatus Levybacteria bacterium]|nr:single-stranded-DNA-specific exonuclease RecJ [Candidatus Levybacteria bacterium]